MKLVLQPHKKNNYPVAGIVIKGNSPLIWLQNLQDLAIPITSYVCYPIPSQIANELYGCLVVMPVGMIQKEHAHFCVQLYENKLFIPEFATISPFLSKEEGDKLLGENLHFFHQELGLIELETAIDWAEILNPMRIIGVRTTAPHSAVFIPKQLKSIHVEYDEATILEALENPLTEEERLEKLPFDMKKLMAGNKKEMEKFLAFMDKNPELAMKYALPLDTLGTFRGNQSGVFKFGSGFFDSFSSFFGFSKSSEKSTTRSSDEKITRFFKVFLKIFGVIFLFFILKELLYNFISSSESLGDNYLGSSSGNNMILTVFILACFGIIMRLGMQSKLGLNGNVTSKSKVSMVIILVIVLYYLVSFMYFNFGLTKWYSIITLVVILRLLYKLFHVEEEIFKENERK
uniref:hypothetical protein n=2 Tax=Flavobacterium sp. TaxID=239 RepID=UPI0040499CDF